MRISLLAVALMMSLTPGSLRGQDDVEVKKLKARVELLEAKLEAANLKIEKLQAENDRLKSGSTSTERTESKADPLAEGTRWKGTFAWASATQSSKGSATVSVIERGDRTVKLSVSYETGAVWTFDCKTDASGHSLTIRGAERAKVANANAGKEATLATIGSTFGTATVRQNKFTMSYTVPNTSKVNLTAFKE